MTSQQSCKEDSFNGILITLVVLGLSLGLCYYIPLWHNQVKLLEIEVNPNLPKYNQTFDIIMVDNAMNKVSKLYPVGNVTMILGKKIGDRQYFDLYIELGKRTWNTTWSCKGDCSQ